MPDGASSTKGQNMTTEEQQNMTTEEQIVKVTKVKESAYKVRQDYLAALVRGIDKLSEDEWDNLSNDVVNWHIAAVGQMDKKRQIEDFKDVTNTLPDEGEDDNSPPEKDEGTSDISSASENDDFIKEPSAEEPLPEQETEEKKPRKSKKAKAEKVKAKSQFENRPEPERYSKITGEKDRFGITIGTKTHEAVKMYNTDEGATLKQVDAALGGRHYNILQKLTKDGHKVEKLAGGYWRVKHKGD